MARPLSEFFFQKTLVRIYGLLRVVWFGEEGKVDSCVRTVNKEVRYTKKTFFDENSSQWTLHAHANAPPPLKEETWLPLPMAPPSRKKKHGPGQ